MKRSSSGTAARRSMYTRFGFNFYDIFIAIFCIGFGIICFYPLWYCVVASVMPYEEYVKGGMMLWFKGFDLQYYIQIFGTRAYVNSLWISVAKTVLGTVLSLLVTSTMAYAVSKSHIKGMKFINLLVVFNLFFAGGLIPTYMLYRDLNLIGRFLVMVIPGALNITYFIIMRNYFSFSVPKELEEAALLDGCNRYQIFWKIMLPLTKPGIVSLVIFTAKFAWNDFMWPLIVNTSPKMMTLGPALSTLQGQYTTKYPMQMAGAVMAVIPIIVLFFIFQKQFIEGVAQSGIKG